MKTFRIAKKTNEVIPTAKLNVISGGTSGNDLYIVVEKCFGSDINAGGKLLFEKKASGMTGEMVKVYEESVGIKNVVKENGYLYIYFEYLYIKSLILTTFRAITSPEGYAFKLYFNTNHNMLPCDICGDYKVFIRRGKNVIEFNDLAFCFPGGITKGGPSCEEEIEEDVVSGWCCDVETIPFNYETMEKNSLLARESGVTAGSAFNPEPGDEVLFATNPFFYIINGKINLFGCDGEIVTISKYTDFMNVGIVMEQDYDAKRMFQEYQANELFVNKIKRSIIPDFIDLEKIKYVPAFLDGPETGETNTFLATGLTFNLHFRERVSGTTDETVNPDVAKYHFEDVWHFNDGMDTWNANGIDDTPKKREDLYLDADFVNSSNLIGYLGFTDDDIYNQKNRVKQTFIRLSFYDDINPLTQNLLYYSTIFFDSGDLYGKYVKRKAWLEDNDEWYDHLLNPVVWSPTASTDECSAITSQLVVNDEYDMTKSGEGFNLYLFREDAPIELYDSEDPENTSQDIYMKVEFNHAGVGRTVPLIYWAKDGDGTPEKLTIENYLKRLYIKVRVAFTDKGYVYAFPDATKVIDDQVDTRKNGILWENERLVFNLFEPMLETTKIVQEDND